MAHNQRIKPKDSAADAIVKLSEGNMVAVEALTSLISADSKTIDPNNLFSGLGYLLRLDAYGIYGTDIYVLYNDICEKDIIKMISTIKSVHAGFLSEKLLKEACGKQDRSGKQMINVDDLYKKVKEKDPQFDNRTCPKLAQGIKVRMINHFLADVYSNRVFTIKSETPHYVGGHLCVWLEEYGCFRVENLEVIEDQCICENCNKGYDLDEMIFTNESPLCKSCYNGLKLCPDFYEDGIVPEEVLNEKED